MHHVLSDRRAQSFWDRIAPKYARKPIADQPAYEQKLHKVASLLRPTDNVLEIGCGTGGTALRLAPGVAQMTGTDISHGMIGIARSKLGPGAPDNVTFRQADAAGPVDGAPFDAICAFSLLHLVGDVPALLTRIHDNLTPGGLFLSKTVCLNDGNILIRTLVSVLHIAGYAPKVTVLSTEAHIEQLRAAGFVVEDVTHFGSGRMSPFIVARRITA